MDNSFEIPQSERPPLEVYDDDPTLSDEPPLSELERWRQEGEEE